MSGRIITDDEFSRVAFDILQHIEEISVEDLAGEAGIHLKDDSCLRENIKLVISGENVQTGKVAVRVLAAVIGGFQNLIDGAANALCNAFTESGPLPNSVKNQTDLQMVGVFAGSFGIEMSVDIDNSLFPDDALITQTLNRVLELVSASDDAEKILNEIAELGFRTQRYYSDWLSYIKNYGVNVKIERTNQFKRNSVYYIEQAKVPAVLEVLNNLKEETIETTQIIGKLTGLNSRKETFEMITANNVVISGKCSKEVSEDSQGLYNCEINGTLRKTVTRNQVTWKEKTVWYLSKTELSNECV